MPPRNLSILFLAAVCCWLCYSKAVRTRYATQLSEAIQLISDNYVKPVEGKELFEGAMQGMVKNLDQYSGYIPPQKFTQFQEELNQKFGGVGIVVELNPDTNRLTVLSPLPGTPADREGIQSGDEIWEIDGQNTEGMTLEDSVKLMRGKPGTPVALGLRRKDVEDIRKLTVKRAIIKTESVVGFNRHQDGKWNFILPGKPRTGYIRVTTFGETTSKELGAAIEEVSEQVDSIVIDLRDNAGGLLVEAIRTADMFIDEGEIVSTRGRHARNRNRFVASSKSTVCPANVKIAVLVNRYSASASEIFSACLQDHDRAIVVGSRTWGKGTVQNIIQLQGKSALRLTTATYWRPSGENIHRHRDDTPEDKWGVTPDFEAELKAEEAEKLRDYRRRLYIPGSAEQNDVKLPTDVDPQLRRAIEELEAPASDVEPRMAA